MKTNSLDLKKVAKNTVMLYIRMFFAMIVGIYTSRIVLQTLGVVDYGVYNVVGGIVAMLGFLNLSLGNATARFITVCIGENNVERLKKVFSTALILHIIIALIVAFVVETAGLWYLTNHLNIPINRVDAAFWVLQFSILSAMISITQVPYNSCVIAHESMDVFAYVEILNSFLKLVIVFFLTICDVDKLILYSILSLGVVVLIASIYRIYCKCKYEECVTRFVFDHSIAKDMIFFSGWNGLGTFSQYAETQGSNLVLNAFFGPIANAAAGLATTVNGIVVGFAGNICMAFNPPIIKSYSNKEWNNFNYLIVNSSKYSLAFFQMLMIPVIFEAPFLLNLWLGSVPQYVVIFMRLILIVAFFDLAARIVNTGIIASAQLKWPCIIASLCFMLSVLLSLILLVNDGSAYYVYVVMIMTHSIILFVYIYYLHKIEPNFKPFALVCGAYIKIILLIVLNSIIIFYLNSVFRSDALTLTTACVSSFAITAIYTLLILANKKERATIVQKTNAITSKMLCK